jgi:ElaB/YqjD/DUF883 family membrane-anchored ribosome-binding protein
MEQNPMNTPAKPYASGPSTPPQSPSPTDNLADTVRGAADSVRNTVGEAVDRGQAAFSHASAATAEVTESASQQVTTFASELAAMTRRNPLGTLAGAAIAGVLVGFLARGRGDRD